VVAKYFDLCELRVSAVNHFFTVIEE
jgi:hypothetical protein